MSVKDLPKTNKELHATACKECAIWNAFGKNCYYFWERKKQCTVWSSKL